MPDSYDIKKLFGKRIKNLRIKHGLTQSQIAELVNVDPKHISCIENGKNFPSASIITKLSSTFEIHPKSLFEFEPEPSIVDLKQSLIKSIENASVQQIEKIFIYTKFLLNN